MSNEREIAFDHWWKLSVHNDTLPSNSKNLAREAYYAAWGGAQAARFNGEQALAEWEGKHGGGK